MEFSLAREGMNSGGCPRSGVGTALMRVVAPNKLLALYAVINVLLCGVVMLNSGWISIYALIGLFFFMSIMFPTIFALSIKDLGQHTKRASSFIIMSVVGGAVVPYVMGTVADHYSTPVSYVVPMLCFVVVFLYGLSGYKVRKA